MNQRGHTLLFARHKCGSTKEECPHDSTKNPSFLEKYFGIRGDTLLFAGIASRVRGNDIKGSGNDIRRGGNNIKGSGNDMKEIFKIILNSLLQLEEKWGKIGSQTFVRIHLFGHIFNKIIRKEGSKIV